MKDKDLFIRYLDNESGTKEREYVENLLKTDQEARQLFEEVKRKREQALKTLKLLNPQEEIIITPFSLKTDKTEKSGAFLIGRRFWRYTAIIIFFLASSVFFLVINKNHTVQNQASSVSTNTEMLVENIDYYISPNRCWNNRHLVITIKKLK